METHDHFQERIGPEERLAARLRLATERLEEARRERIWAVVEAHQSGLSVRQIAAATGLSSSRAHQLLGSDEARRVRHRQRSAEPEPPPKPLSRREERAAARRASRDLPPSERDGASAVPIPSDRE